MFGRRKKVALTLRTEAVVLAVRPTAGAPGASTIAAAMAALLVSGGNDVILVDCDVTRGTLAMALDPSPGVNLGAALSTLPTGDAPLPNGYLRETSWGARFLPGVLGPFAPVRIHADRLHALLVRLRRSCEVLVLDLGEELEPPHGFLPPPRAGLAIGPGQDGGNSDRYSPGANHTTALALADVVLLVAADTPQGEVDLVGEFPLVHQALRACPDPPALVTVVNHMATHHYDHWRKVLRGLGRKDANCDGLEPRLDGFVPHDHTAACKTWAARPRRPLPLADPHSVAADALSRLGVVVADRLSTRRLAPT